MPHAFNEIAFTDAVKAEQQANGSRASYARFEVGPDIRRVFGAPERAFIESRTSIYLSTVNSEGWPYIQHRGGGAGFLRVADEQTLVMPDFSGNRQYVTTGNLKGSAKAALFLMDYTNKRRMKIFAEAEVISALDDRLPDMGQMPERGLLFHLQGYDWNCPKFIPDLFEPAAVQQVAADMVQQIAELEAEVARLKG